MWADDARLSKHRAADYLNAGTSEVESSASIFEMIFPAIEKFSHFLFNLVFVIFLDPSLLPMFFLLIPITLMVQKSRGKQMSILLDKRQQTERQYVASLADIVENTHTFRSMPSSGIRQSFSQDTKNFASSHLTALKFSITTKERIEYVQGVMLSMIYFLNAVCVNWVIEADDGSRTTYLSKGTAVGIITAFNTSSSDIIDMSNMYIKMKFQSAGLRMLSKFLNFPTDSHQLVVDAPNRLRKLCSSLCARETPLTHTDDKQRRSSEMTESLSWMHEIVLQDTGFLSNIQQELTSAKALDIVNDADHLAKEGYVKKKMNNGRWESLFFVMDGRRITKLYANEEDAELGENVKDSFSACGLEMVKNDGFSQAGFLFTLFVGIKEGEEKTTFSLACDSEEERLSWVDHFEAACNHLNVAALHEGNFTCINCRIKLGGMIFLWDAGMNGTEEEVEHYEDVRDITLRLIAGVILPPKGDVGKQPYAQIHRSCKTV